MDTSAQTYFAHIGHPELIAVEIGHPTIPAAAPRTTDGIKTNHSCCRPRNRGTRNTASVAPKTICSASMPAHQTTKPAIFIGGSPKKSRKPSQADEPNPPEPTPALPPQG